MSNIGFLAKFGDKMHLHSLQENGLIFMNPVSYFRKCEKEEIGDSKECIDSYFINPIITFSATINGNRQTIMDKVCSATIDFEEKEFTHLFCMFCICDGDTIREDHKLFDDRLKSFGDSLLFIYNPKEFARRLINELQKKMSEDKDVSNFKAHKVEYINRSSYNGEMGSFRKFNNFAHQQEWRIAIQSVYNSEEPYKLVIGSIKDISIILPLKDVKNQVLVDGSKITLCL